MFIAAVDFRYREVPNSDCILISKQLLLTVKVYL